MAAYDFLKWFLAITSCLKLNHLSVCLFLDFFFFFETAAQDGCRKDERVKQMGAMSAQGHAVFCRQQTLGPH